MTDPTTTSPDRYALCADPVMDALLDERDHILLADRLAGETAAVRSIEARVDTKANSLLTLCSGLLVAGLALLSSGKLPGPAAGAGWAGAAVIGAAVVLLTMALRPNLGGDFGFVRWARTTGGQDVLDVLAAEPDHGQAAKAAQLVWLSQSLYRKFARIRTAQTLLVTALALAATAAALTALAR